MVQYKAGLPLSPYSQKFGYEIPERFSSETWRSLDITMAISRLQEQASKYQGTFIKDSTLLNYRDYFVYKAYEYFSRNTQYSVSDGSGLTNKASNSWQSLSFDDIWPYTSPGISGLKEPPVYCGEMGSVAYYSQYVDSKLPLPLIIDETLRFIWAICGSSYNTLPNKRLLEVVNNCGFTKEMADLLESYSNNLFQLLPSSEFYFLLVYARRRAIFPSSFSNLFLKTLLGEYPPELFNCLLPLIPSSQQPKIQTAIRNLSLLFPPSGIILLFQSLICEAFIRCAIYITSLDPHIHNLSLSEIESSKDFNFITFEISRFLCLAFDSISAISVYNTHIEARSELSMIEKDIVSWLSISKLSVPDTDDYRLFSFV